MKERFLGMTIIDVLSLMIVSGWVCTGGPVVTQFNRGYPLVLKLLISARCEQLATQGMGWGEGSRPSHSGHQAKSELRVQREREIFLDD